MAASITFEEGSRVPSSVDESRPFSSLNRFLSRSISLRLLKPLSSSPPFSVLSACSLRLAALRHSVSRRDSSTARSSGLIRASRAASSSAFSSQKAVRSSSGVLLSLAVTAVSDAASGREEEEERELLRCFESRSAPTKASRRGTASATSAVESSASSSGSAARRRLRGAMMMVRCLAFGCSLLFFWFVCVWGGGRGASGGGHDADFVQSRGWTRSRSFLSIGRVVAKSMAGKKQQDDASLSLSSALGTAFSLH